MVRAGGDEDACRLENSMKGVPVGTPRFRSNPTLADLFFSLFELIFSEGVCLITERVPPFMKVPTVRSLFLGQLTAVVLVYCGGPGTASSAV